MGTVTVAAIANPRDGKPHSSTTRHREIAKSVPQLHFVLWVPQELPKEAYGQNYKGQGS